MTASDAPSIQQKRGHDSAVPQPVLKGFELGPALQKLARIQNQWAKGKPVEHFPLKEPLPFDLPWGVK